MKQKHMIAKTVLMTTNVLFALYLFNTSVVMGKRHEVSTGYALKVLEESGALDADAVTRYVSESKDIEFGFDPVATLRQSKYVTFHMFEYLIIPALCLLLANAVVMGLCWKRRITQEEEKEAPTRLPDGSDTSASNPHQ